MKCKTILLMTAMLLGVYVGLSSLVQARWNSECAWVVAVDTRVYTPGTADEIAVMLPAGTGCRVVSTEINPCRAGQQDSTRTHGAGL